MKRILILNPEMGVLERRLKTALEKIGERVVCSKEVGKLVDINSFEYIIVKSDIDEGKIIGNLMKNPDQRVIFYGREYGQEGNAFMTDGKIGYMGKLDIVKALEFICGQ